MADDEGKEKEEEGKKEENLPEIDAKKVAEIAKQAIGEDLKKDLEKMVKEVSPQVPMEQIQEAVKNSLQSLLGGGALETSQPELDPVLQTMVEDPRTFFQELVNAARSLAKEDIKQETAADKARRLAADKVLRDRVDITATDESRRLLLHLYTTTDESDDEETRWKKAVSSYDALLEAQGAGKAEDRIKRAAGSISGGKGRMDVADPGKSEVDEKALMREEMQQRREAYKKARNGAFYVPQ